MKVPNRRLIALALLALIGAAVAVSQTQQFYELRSGTAAFKSFCNIGETVNCDAVAASPYAELIAGLPLSGFALAWFAALFFVALIARNVYWRRESIRVAFLISGTGLVCSVAFFAVMISVLKTFCLLCLVTDVVNISSFLIVLSLKPEWIKVHKPDWKKWKIMIGAVAGCLLVTIATLKLSAETPYKATEINDAANRVWAAPVLPVDDGQALPSIGPKDAPVTIVEFSDFQCPFCRNGALIVNSIMQKYPGKIRLIFRNFPLDPSCNRNVTSGGHSAACESAKSVFCGFRQNKFQPVYEALFDRQNEIAPGRAISIALEAGAEDSALKACLDSTETELAINADIEEAIRLGVHSTPTFFINGKKLEGAYPVQVWSKIIDKILQNK
ncbi:MAG: hypothetical protein A3K03_01120 [Bdellovibrionales bacterium RIFOXYD1_FULL_44_7]|nr:MAG: hypothetical protein A3K03_01120 [Bdellovibrionales bacterium RIFOXYD1_FULL_44_7]